MHDVSRTLHIDVANTSCIVRSPLDQQVTELRQHRGASAKLGWGNLQVARSFAGSGHVGNNCLALRQRRYGRQIFLDGFARDRHL